MTQVDTLYVVASGRGSYVLQDMYDSVLWASDQESRHIVVVDSTSTLQEASLNIRHSGMFEHSQLPQNVDDGFHAAWGAACAIEHGVEFKQAVLITDTALLLRQRIISMFEPKLAEERLGAFGVAKTGRDAKRWAAAKTALLTAGVDLTGNEETPPSIRPEFTVVTAPAMHQLFRQSLLMVSDDVAASGIDWGDYLSWILQSWKLGVVLWGSDTRPMPPLYVTEAPAQYLPPPHMLADMFTVYCPVTRVMSYGERECRELFKRYRGEATEPIPARTPVVAGLSAEELPN